MREMGLDHSVGFLLGVVYRKLSLLLASRIREYDLTPEQWAVLFRVGERDGQIQKDIAERAGKDKPTTTRLLNALEEKGFITRQAGTKDKRSFVIRATDKGLRTIAAVAPIERATIRDACEGMTEETYESLMVRLAEINDNVERLLHQETE